MSPPAMSRRMALGGLSAGALAACARRRPADRLRVAYSPPTLSGLYRTLARAFEETQPGITVELMPAATYGAVMQRDFRLALVEDEPDVSHIGLNGVRFYAERGLAAPLDRRIAAASTPLPFHASIGRHGGATRALPFAVSVPVTYVNRRLAKQAGWDIRALAPMQWPDLLVGATAISGLGGPVSGIFFDYTPEAALGWQMLVRSRGGDLLTPDERAVAFDGPAGLWAARLLRDLGRAGQRDLSRENARMAFAAGQLGMYQNTSANLARFQKTAPGVPLAVAPLPVAPGGRLPAAGNAAVIVTRDPGRQDLAWAYVEFVCGPVGQTIMARETGYLTLNRAALAQSRGLAQVLASRPLYADLYRALDQLDAWYAFPGPRGEQAAQAISARMRDLILGRITPEAGLAAMAAETRRLLWP